MDAPRRYHPGLHRVAPVRERYKIFIIDEVHSSQSFVQRLQKSLRAAASVIFMMATRTDEFGNGIVALPGHIRAISSKDFTPEAADRNEDDTGDDVLQLIARRRGSMRDAEQAGSVIAFTGKAITEADVATVLGLVGRDLLLDAVQAVADEDAAAAFALTASAVEMGYDLRAVCRELSRVTRDLLVLTVDPSRINDPEISGEGESDRLKALAARFSREDLLRAFDLLTRAELEIRNAAQPRYNLEMTLLRWIHLRKLVSIEDLCGGSCAAMWSSFPLRSSGQVPDRACQQLQRVRNCNQLKPDPTNEGADYPATGGVKVEGNFKGALLGEIRKSKATFYNTVVAGPKIDVAGGGVTFVFSAAPILKGQCSGAGRTISVRCPGWPAESRPPERVWRERRHGGRRPVKPPRLRRASRTRRAEARRSAQALADAGVRAPLMFPAEIRG